MELKVLTARTTPRSPGHGGPSEAIPGDWGSFVVGSALSSVEEHNVMLFTANNKSKA